MKIYSVSDAEFLPYGRIVEGAGVRDLMDALKKMPVPEGVEYVPSEPTLEKLPGAKAFAESLYGGMPAQIGLCSGRNTRLNCMEYHRDSEFNLGADDFVLLVAKQHEIEDSVLDTAKVKAFLAPAGTLVEVYATTLHYAPCHADPAKGFRVMVALPLGTNTDKSGSIPQIAEDKLLWARNKWLLAHPDSAEAGQGAWIGLKGENIDISK